MIEDKLTHDERIRLECLAQAIGRDRTGNTDQILALARSFEEFVREGRQR